MLKKIVGNSSLHFIALMLNRGIAFLLLPIYTNYMLPSEYGVIAICAAVMAAFSPVLSFDLSGAVNLFYFKLDQAEYKKLLSTIWLWYLTVPLLITALLATFGSYVSDSIFPAVAWHPYLYLAVWITFLNLAQELPLAVYFAEQKAARHAILTIGFFLITTSLILYFVVVRREGALGSLQGQAIGLVIVSIISHILIFRRFGSLREITFSPKYLRAAFRLCAPIVPYTVFSWAINLSDRWILGYFVSTAEIGIYSIAYTLGALVATVGTALRAGFTPVYYEQHANAEYRRRLPALISFHVLANTAATLAVCLLSPELLRIIASPAYHEAWRFVPFIAGGYWFYSCFHLLFITVIQNTGRTQWILLLTAPAAIVKIGLNWLLVSIYGVWAAAFTTLLAFMLMALVAYLISRRMDKLPYSWKSLALIVVTSTAAYFAGVFWLTFENLILSVAAKSCLLIFASALITWQSGFSVRRLRQFLERRKVAAATD